MLDHNGPGRGIAVANGVDVLFPLLGYLGHGAMRDHDLGDLLFFRFLFLIHKQAEVGRVRQQTFFTRLDGIHQTLTGKRVGFEHVETTPVECEIAAVVNPKSTKHRRLRRIPDRYFFRVDASLENGHHRRLVLANGDAVLKLVLEQIAEFLGLRHGGCSFERLRYCCGFKVVTAATANSENPAAGTTAVTRTESAADSAARARQNSANNASRLTSGNTTGNAAG